MTKTAGMVHGTPDWQLDHMYEAEGARIWEEQNREMPVSDIDYALGDAWTQLCTVCDKLAEAAEHADGFPVEQRIMSMLSGVEEMQDEIRRMREKLPKGA